LIDATDQSQLQKCQIMNTHRSLIFPILFIKMVSQNLFEK